MPWHGAVDSPDPLGQGEANGNSGRGRGRSQTNQWLWVKHRITPKCLALVNGDMDAKMRSPGGLILTHAQMKNRHDKRANVRCGDVLDVARVGCGALRAIRCLLDLSEFDSTESDRCQTASTSAVVLTTSETKRR